MTAAALTSGRRAHSRALAGPLRFIGGRLLQGVVVVFGAVVISFILTSMIGNPAEVLAGSFIPPAEAARIRHALGYDVPLLERFANYVSRLVRGDFGTSYRSGESAASMVLGAAPYTMALVVGAMLLASLIAFPAAVLGVLRRDSRSDRVVSSALGAAQAVPDYWLGLILVLIFAVSIPIFPVVGYSGPASAVLPIVALGLPFTSTLLRLIRGQLLDTMGLEFVNTLRAKGMSDRRIVLTHGLRNALPPVITFLALQTGLLIGGTIVVEAVFGWPGIGTMLLDAVGARDVIVVQAIVIFVAVGFVVLNLVADVLVLLLVPRVRVSGR
jgi:ABC-type dipeptide/oligopeptide/nickel transport system permease component